MPSRTFIAQEEKTMSSQQRRFFSICAHAIACWIILLTTELTAPAVLVTTSRHGSHRKHPTSKSNSTIACIFIAIGTDLLSHCPEMVTVYRATT
jgi:hypothetical protein